MATTSGPDLIERIKQNAERDGIDLSILPFHQEALDSIVALSTDAASTPSYDFSKATKIDTHTHPIPDWFRALEPQAAGRDTPSWSVSAHLQFMSEHQITRSVLCISTPQANAFMEERDGVRRMELTTALARLLNEFCAELCRLYPDRFSWLAVMPLPYTYSAWKEAQYALHELDAVGVGVLTNHEGSYLGEEKFDALWGYLEKIALPFGKFSSGSMVVFIHPTEPIIRLDDGRLINSRPSPLRSGLGEFYFETARAISSITANQTITKYTHLHWRISHGAGAFPDISERFLLGFPDNSEHGRRVYKERFWYDSAGPVFPNQVKGLTEGMGIPVSQLVFGTDYPYGIGFWDVNANIAGLADAASLSTEEKEQVFSQNAKRLWGNLIKRS